MLGQRTKQIVLITVIVVLCGLAWFGFHRIEEPIHKGIPISAWVNDIGSGQLSWHDSQNEFLQIGPSAVPYLIDGLKRQNSAFSKIYSNAYWKLPLAVRTGFPRPRNADAIRLGVPNILREMKADAVPAIPALIEALSDSNPGVRMNSALALGSVRSYWPKADPARTNYDKQAVTALIKLMSDPDNSVRGNAESSIAFFGDARTNAIPALIHIATSDVGYARWKAISALIGMKALNPNMTAMLEAAAKSGDENVEFQANRALTLLRSHPPNATMVGEE